MSDYALAEEAPAMSAPAAAAERPRPVISRGEWGLLLVLSAVQFTHIIDFMIVTPLGPPLRGAAQDLVERIDP